jgi:hypothetical protein
MMRPFSFSTKFSWLTLCLGLLGTAAFELVVDEHGIRVVAEQPNTVYSLDQLEPEAPEFRAPPRDMIDVIVARPLFSPSRRPEVAAALKSDGEDVTFELIAVLLTGSQRAALVRIGAQEQPVWVHERDWLSSWRVETIRADHLRVERRSEVRIVTARSDPAG